MTSVDLRKEILDQLRTVRKSIEEDLERWKTRSSGAFCDKYIRKREEQLECINMLYREMANKIW